LFVNLIGNAVKYRKPNVVPHLKIVAEEAKPEELKFFSSSPESAYYKISVIDNGIGFANEYKDKIFEPFQRLHGKDEYSGTGIGLAICSKIMTNHHGFLTAESAVGKGAAFNIFVPK
jgi:signal transduction histidine kinase